jgi:hypothetical protein
MEGVLTTKAEEKKPSRKAAPDSFSESAPRSGERGVSEGMPLFLRHKVQTKLVVGAPDDPLEREADQIADHVVQGRTPPLTNGHSTGKLQRKCECDGSHSHGKCPACQEEEEKRVHAKAQGGASSQPASVPAALNTSAGTPLTGSVRERVEPVLGADLGHVRVHSETSDQQTAQALQAKAFTYQNHIWLGPNQSAEDLGLMAHEAAHVVQQSDVVRRTPGDGAPAANQNETLACVPPKDANYSFIPPEAPPAAPACIPTEVQIQSPAADIAKPRTETVVLDEPVLRNTPIVLYAIPIELTEENPDKDSRPICIAPPAPQSRPKGDSDQPPPVAGPVTVPPLPGVPRPAARPVLVEGQPVIAEVVTSAYVLTSQYHHLAVGAGSVNVLETAQGVRLIDAGVGMQGGEALSQAIADKIASTVADRPILEVLITHLHADHTNLLPKLAGRFAIGKLRVSAVQFADPRFKKLLQDVATAQANGVRDRAAAEFDARRADWDKGEGGTIADAALRDEAFQNAKQQHVREAMRKLAENPTQVELLVPGEGRLVVENAPLGDLPSLAGATTDPVTEGLRRTGQPGDISDTAFTDPSAGEKLAKQRERQKTDPNAEIPDADVDTASTSWIIDLPAGNRLMVVPDVRTDDLRRKVKDTTGAKRANFEAELAKLSPQKARFQAWNMTHHMQSGWVAGKAPHIGGAAELDAFIALMQNIREVQKAQRAPGQAAPADMVVVSAQHSLARSMINPGMVWFLRSLGFDVFLASSGRDVRLIEATTAGGRKVEGVAGLPYEGARPSDPLLMQSEAAVRFIDKKVQFEQTRKASPRMKAADKSALKADREANITRLTAAKDRVLAAREAYIREASRELWRGPDEAGKPATAPDPAAGPSPSIAAAEKVLRDAMKDPDLADFTLPTATEAPLITDTALVLMRIQEKGGTLDTQGRQILEANQRLDVLRAKLHNGEATAETKAQLSSELEQLRELLREQIPKAPEASKPVLEEELLHTQKELESLVHSKEGQVLFSREPGTGRLIENRVVKALAPKSPAADRMRARLDVAGRFLGAVMIYQTVRGEAELEKQVATGQATVGQGVVGTAKNIEGVAIGVRMMSGVHVHPAEFVVMSVLDVTETALGNYDTPEDRAVALSKTGMREGITLFLMVVGQAMMKSPNPYVVAAGFGIGFLTEPIMAGLEAMGVFDAVERASAFLPSEVTKANQDLRDLMKEYRAILGAMELASRSDEQLTAVGVGDPQALRSTSSTDIATYRTRAAEKEQELLSAFDKGYTRAQTEFAGLYELDDLRGQFLVLRQKAHIGDTDRGDSSRQVALDAFARIDKSLSLDQKSADEINDMPQWDHLDEAMNDFVKYMNKSEVDWEDVRKKEQDIEQMLRNARYRLDPKAFGMRSQPLLSPNTPGRLTYESKLKEKEARMNDLQRAMIEMASAASLTGIGDKPGEVAPNDIEAILAAYERLLEQAPARPFSAQQLSQHSMAAGPEYRDYVNEHSDYKSYLERLHASELGLRALAQRAIRSQTGQPTETAATLGDRINSAVSKRKGLLGLFYLDEVEAQVSKVREQEIKKLAPLLDEAPGTTPLSENEKAALAKGELKDYSTRVTTVTNQLQQVAGLRIPDKPEDWVAGIYRFEGEIEGVGYTARITKDKNVLVGVTGGRESAWSPMRGDYFVQPVVPVNASAIQRLPGSQKVDTRYLQPVQLRELTENQKKDK